MPLEGGEGERGDSAQRRKRRGARRHGKEDGRGLGTIARDRREEECSMGEREGGGG